MIRGALLLVLLLAACASGGGGAEGVYIGGSAGAFYRSESSRR